MYPVRCISLMEGVWLASNHRTYFLKVNRLPCQAKNARGRLTLNLVVLEECLCLALVSNFSGARRETTMPWKSKLQATKKESPASEVLGDVTSLESSKLKSYVADDVGRSLVLLPFHSSKVPKLLSFAPAVCIALLLQQGHVDCYLSLAAGSPPDVGSW